MNDNEVILQLQADLFAVLNKSKMPVMVKALIVENALLKLNAELSREREEQLRANQEVNLHVDELNLQADSANTAEVKDDAD